MLFKKMYLGLSWDIWCLWILPDLIHSFSGFLKGSTRTFFHAIETSGFMARFVNDIKHIPRRNKLAWGCKKRIELCTISLNWLTLNLVSSADLSIAKSKLIFLIILHSVVLESYVFGIYFSFFLEISDLTLIWLLNLYLIFLNRNFISL